MAYQLPGMTDEDAALARQAAGLPPPQDFAATLNQIDAATGVNPAMGTPNAARVGAPPPVPVSQMVANIKARQPATEPPKEDTGATDLAAQGAASKDSDKGKSSDGGRTGGGTALSSFAPALAGVERKYSGKIAEADQKRIDALKEQHKAEKEIRDATAKLKQFENVAAAQEAIADKEAADRDAALNAEAQKATSEKMAKAEELQKKYTDGKINSGRMWDNMSTGKKVLAGIAVALGAIGQTLTGRDNGALAVINQAIDADVASQEKDLERARQGSLDVKSDLADLRQIYGDKLTASKAAKLAAIGKARAQLAQSLEGVDAELSVAEGRKLDAQLAQQEAELKADIANTQMGRETDTLQKRFMMTQGAEAMAFERAKAGATAAPTESAAIRPIRGTAPTEEQSKKAAELYVKSAPAVSMARRMEALSKKLGTGEKLSMTSADAQEARALATMAPAAISQSFGQGALSEEEREAFAEIARDPSSFDWRGKGAAINTGLRRMINDNLNEGLKAYNMEMNIKASPDKWQEY